MRGLLIIPFRRCWKRGSAPFLLLFAILLFPAGCDLPEGREHDPALIVGERRVCLEELKKEMNYLSPGPGSLSDPSIRKRLLERVIDRYLMMEFARVNGLSISPEEISRAMADIRRGYSTRAFQDVLMRECVDPEELEHWTAKRLLLERVLRAVKEQVRPPSSEEIKRFYEANLARFRVPASVRFRQIFTRDAGKARQLAERLKNGEDFGTLARTYSEGPEADRNGEVGWISKGQLEQSMEKALFSQEPGRPGSVVQTPYGFHIFQVLERRPARVRTLPEVLDQIEMEIFERRCEVRYRKWLKGLRERFPVKLSREALAALELS
ncbi:MAG: peptidylprolyl isomerase [Deltaproteobacteria bacterium]|nr:peptidylprolyl isomerase [Deltaproteobacteria bacterium]MBW1923348.1 peptidylprolyl isomerase [Deltaproteobacteria bacterium]MBW1949578.1 peptidylprolyl isomerase [Deltaproteobacteria bacterium]MBW2348233.1 peptidylprolyl isomerase [Deltaproteobacteria bacterium]RLB34377.1 MAG: hypothetical protein DRH20_12170 [Deltaproteobacteria bacterium]